MAENVNQILSEARNICREPSHEQLPLHFMVRAFNRVQTYLSNSLSLSQHNQLLVKKYLGTPARDFLVSELTHGSLVTVEQRVSDQDDSWVDIPIVNRTAINEAMNYGLRRAAKYGNRIRLSWTPADGNDSLQLWYEPSSTDARITDGPTIKKGYHPLLAYMLAKECWEGWMDKPARTDINDGIAMYMRQFDRDVNKTPEQRPRMRPTAYGVGRK